MEKTNTRTYDVIVIGGGTAGVIAAVQAGRANARTLLVEKNGMLGGTTTVAAVDFPGIFHAWGKQVIAGIGWELVHRCIEGGDGVMPDLDTPQRQHFRQHAKVNGPVYAALCDEAVTHAGVDLLLHTMLAKMDRTDTGWDVTLCTKTGLTNVNARVVIDGTGDANAVQLAGGELRLQDDVQPATLICQASGYDCDTLDMNAINKAAQEAVANGALRKTDFAWNMESATVDSWLKSYGGNRGHIPSPNAHDSEGKTQVELEARKALLRVYRFFRSQPGLEDLHLDTLAPECGIRETATVVGDVTVALDDYLSGRPWDDAVCYSYYPVDLHKIDGDGLDYRMLEPGTLPTVPAGALIPKGLDNILAAGRCISSDRLAHSALRTQATCMATGQAAGAMAALAAKTGCDVRAVPRDELIRLLEEHGAIVPPDAGSHLA